MTDHSSSAVEPTPVAPVAQAVDSGSGRGTELPPVPRPTIAQLCDAIECCASCAEEQHDGDADTAFLAARVLREAMYLLREYRSRPHHPSLEVAGYHQLGMIEDDTVQRAFNLLREVRP